MKRTKWGFVVVSLLFFTLSTSIALAVVVDGKEGPTNTATALATNSSTANNVTNVTTNPAGGQGGKGGDAAAAATAPTTVAPDQKVTVKYPMQIPPGAFPQSDGVVQPKSAESTCIVFLPSEMTVADAANIAGESSSKNKEAIKILYTEIEDVKEIRKEMAGYSIADYAGMESKKGDVYMTPLGKVIYDLALKGARTVVIIKLSSSFKGTYKVRGIGVSGTGGTGGPSGASGGLFGINFGSSTTSLDEETNVVGIGFKNPASKK